MRRFPWFLQAAWKWT